MILNMVKAMGGEGGGGGGSAGGVGVVVGGMVLGAALGSAKGNVFSDGGVEKFAKGGIVSGPTTVPMALMGEAGRKEAVLPLGRDGHGDLGVKASIDGGGGTTVHNYNMSIQAMDSKSFMDFARKNPGVFATMFKENVAKGDSATLSAINSARGR